MNIEIRNMKDHVGEEITLRGWMCNKRESGKIIFLELRDGSGFLQGIVGKDSVSEEVFETAKRLTIESSVHVTGEVTKHPRQDDVFELQVKNIKIIQLVEGEYPIGKKDHGPDFLLNNRHLWLRSESQWAVLRIRHLVKTGFQKYFNENSYIELDTPTFTPNACEGTTDLFEVKYFDDTAYLTQNGQLYLEAMCMAFGKVYDLCPNFRAEKSKTRKHLTEFWTLNPEIAFIDHEESLKIQEECMKAMVKFVLEHGKKELEMLERNIKELEMFLEIPFIHYEYPDAIKKLQELGSGIKYGEDLGAPEEELLTKDSDAGVIVKNWPKSIKPFYMKNYTTRKTDPSNGDRVFNADVLAPRGFGEIIGGSQREDDYKKLLEGIKSHNLPVSIFEWYLDLRKYGSVPHCGFGIGIERMTRWVSGIHHIRETIPFPRMLNRLTP
ncbi:asparagine--tRNA ligase [Candidatus Peregrinibacteria bacterium]|nr:asparagine--tRNA ligase [Candidatus Peregrinibacteria bacterium]